MPDERAPRSVSQYKDYTQCPEAYRLKRIEKVWERPAAWLAQGVGVHEAAEAFEKSERQMPLDDVKDVFRDSYTKMINRDTATTPNLEYWFNSGPYAGAADVERRYGKGLDQTEALVDYYTSKKPGEVIWVTPDGTPAVELGFNIDLGGVPVRGFIDQVITTERGGVVVRDIKTGVKPGDAFQLAVYGEALRQAYGVNVVVGDFWMGRNGKPTVPLKLDAWPTEKLADAFTTMDAAVQAGDFPADPSPSKCGRCPVALSCVFSQA